MYIYMYVDINRYLAAATASGRSGASGTMPPATSVQTGAPDAEGVSTKRSTCVGHFVTLQVLSNRLFSS